MPSLSKRNSVDAAPKFDDLTAIKGIREARQQWFRDTMNVRTYYDLAALSVDQIESGLKAERQFPSRSMIAAWIAQAEALAETNDNQVPTANRQVASSWEPFASFVIEFQVFENPDGSRKQRTTVHHIETDKNQLWLGIETQQSMLWMLAAAGIETESTDLQQPDESELHPSSPSHPANFSDELRHALAKSAQLTGSPMLPEISPDKVKPTLQQKPNPSRPSGFSDRLQEILARTQRLTSKTN